MSAELNRLQSWMQAAITHGGGIWAGLGAGVGPREVAEVVRPSATLTAEQRLSIYNRSYHARMFTCLEHMFPALLHALGEELFRAFALDYLAHYPPSSYTIDHLADFFPDHLSRTRPDADAPQAQREQWCDFICDLAKLELEFLEVFDGPGLEGRPLPSVPALLAMDDERLLSLRPAPAPCLRLLSFRFPVHDYLVAVRRQENPDVPPAKRSLVAMTRWNYRVLFHDLPADQYATLENINGRRSVSELLGPEVDLQTFRPWLASWTAKGLMNAPE